AVAEGGAVWRRGRGAGGGARRDAGSRGGRGRVVRARGAVAGVPAGRPPTGGADGASSRRDDGESRGGGPTPRGAGAAGAGRRRARAPARDRGGESAEAVGDPRAGLDDRSRRADHEDERRGLSAGL